VTIGANMLRGSPIISGWAKSLLVFQRSPVRSNPICVLLKFSCRYWKSGLCGLMAQAPPSPRPTMRQLARSRMDEAVPTSCAPATMKRASGA